MCTDLTIGTATWKGALSSGTNEVLQYHISYPVVTSTRFRRESRRINRYYRQKARAFERYLRRKQYPLAVKSCQYAQKHGYPFLPFEADTAFTITYNECCSLSLYLDQYLYTGGAHGMTTRSSDTWDLPRGRLTGLDAYLADQAYARTAVQQQIEDQIENGNPMDYFDNYQDNIRQSFRKQQFYLTDAGVMLYFQQYDLAPYSSGIPVFLLAYDGDLVREPVCDYGKA